MGCVVVNVVPSVVTEYSLQAMAVAAAAVLPSLVLHRNTSSRWKARWSDMEKACGHSIWHEAD